MTQPRPWPFRSTDPRVTPAPTAQPEPEEREETRRKCEEGCNGCDDCTDYHKDDTQ